MYNILVRELRGANIYQPLKTNTKYFEIQSEISLFPSF